FQMLRRSLVLCALVAITIGKLCPNPEYSCPESATCCLLADGEYGCCPMPEATCCEDHLHCCPGGQQCDTEQGTCSGANGEVTRMMRKYRARKTNKGMEESSEEEETDPVIDVSVNEDIVCPGGKDRCPPITTCCELETGAFGCCPSPHAVCCQDHMHCCPDGYRCDASSERCRQQAGKDIFTTRRVIPSLRKFPSTPNVVKQTINYRDVKPRFSVSEKQKRPIECGKTTGCSKGHTCCQMLDDEEGPFAEPACCPIADATCCSHGCCPNNYVCSRNGRSCEKPALSEEAQYLRLLKKAWFNEN
ncbi:hypothetical protein PFISCL1PPCAC_18011, partial [Pristionchus fissidentatus]